ncbi:hypothetical protein DSM26151_07650 [Agromyces marinus]|uniref:VanZ-like domain-containing protein n=1 Tax=Agromyces marinus TaxID=1389020 RepID=A0ABN6Y983_9MICO|nr:hypothetical protein DSM26151_07650 [Agromyces marinus]BDZ53905.1 hypothetical protein GCM10025870_09780 [Agromyces marinus]
MVLALVGVVYAVALGFVLFWPVHVDGEGGLIRVDGLIEALARFGMPAHIRYPVVQSGLNAVLFLPFGALWAAWFARPRIHLVLSAGLLAAAVSLSAELAQSAYLPGRTYDLRDVLANSVGAAIGALAVVLGAQSVRPATAARDAAAPGAAASVAEAQRPDAR